MTEQKPLYFADQPEKFYTDHFKNHKITKLGENFYRWGEPNTFTFQSFIIITDQRLIVYGDLYDWMFAAGKDRTMPFLRQVCKHNNFQYFVEKITTKEEPYNADETKKYLLNFINEEDNEPNDETLHQILDCGEYEYLHGLDEDSFDRIAKEIIIAKAKKLDYENHEEVMAFARDCGYEPDYEILTTSWHNTQAVWIFFALKTFMMEFEPDLFIINEPKDQIRTEFYNYLIKIGHSSENIQVAWDAVVKLCPDELTREVTCRDLLNINEKCT